MQDINVRSSATPTLPRFPAPATRSHHAARAGRHAEIHLPIETPYRTRQRHAAETELKTAPPQTPTLKQESFAAHSGKEHASPLLLLNNYARMMLCWNLNVFKAHFSEAFSSLRPLHAGAGFSGFRAAKAPGPPESRKLRLWSCRCFHCRPVLQRNCFCGAPTGPKSAWSLVLVSQGRCTLETSTRPPPWHNSCRSQVSLRGRGR